MSAAHTSPSPAITFGMPHNQSQRFGCDGSVDEWSNRAQGERGGERRGGADGQTHDRLAADLRTEINPRVPRLRWPWASLLHVGGIPAWGQDLVKRAGAGVACPLGECNPLCHDATLPLRVTEKEGRNGRRRFPLRYGPALSGPSQDEASPRAFSPLAESLVDATVLAAARACACMMKKSDEGEKEERTFGQCSQCSQSVSQ